MLTTIAIILGFAILAVNAIGYICTITSKVFRNAAMKSAKERFKDEKTYMYYLNRRMVVDSAIVGLFVLALMLA